MSQKVIAIPQLIKQLTNAPLMSLIRDRSSMYEDCGHHRDTQDVTELGQKVEVAMEIGVISAHAEHMLRHISWGASFTAGLRILVYRQKSPVVDP